MSPNRNLSNDAGYLSLNKAIIYCDTRVLTTVYCPGYGVMFLKAHSMSWCMASCRVNDRDV